MTIDDEGPDRCAMGIRWVGVGTLVLGACSTEKAMQDIHNQVAQDAVAQYELAKKGGDKIQVCVQAGMVTAAFLQAKDEPSYLAWKKTESEACAAAGMPKP